MKLSDLVQYRNTLRDVSQSDGLATISEKFNPILHTIENNQIQIEDLSSVLKKDLDSINQAAKIFYDNVGKVFAGIDKAIDELQPMYFAQSYRLYDKEMRNDSAEYILNRRFNPTPAAMTYLTARIQIHSNWQYPGMIIRPGLENWEDILVGLDPLYLVDQSHALLDPIRSKFNKEYQNRLRYYVINEDHNNIMEDFPKSQMSFCLAYNFFSYKPLEIVKKYLSEIYEILRPGGAFCFTFVDGDRHGGARLAENNFVCYTPGSILKNLAISLGYEIGQTYEIDAANTWMEIHKPGISTSLRGGQSLARIVAKSK